MVKKRTYVLLRSTDGGIHSSPAPNVPNCDTVRKIIFSPAYSQDGTKQISTDSSPDRNLQFEYLAELRSRFQRRHLPIISRSCHRPWVPAGRLASLYRLAPLLILADTGGSNS